MVVFFSIFKRRKKCREHQKFNDAGKKDFGDSSRKYYLKYLGIIFFDISLSFSRYSYQKYLSPKILIKNIYRRYLFFLYFIAGIY
jgi:hypothetical protein